MCTRMHVCVFVLCTPCVVACLCECEIAVGAIAAASSYFSFSSFFCILFHSFSLIFFVVDRLSSMLSITNALALMLI